MTSTKPLKWNTVDHKCSRFRPSCWLPLHAEAMSPSQALQIPNKWDVSLNTVYDHYISEDWTFGCPQRPEGLGCFGCFGCSRLKWKGWSIFSSPGCWDSLPFNVWSAGIISVSKSHLKIHFYRLLSIEVSFLCRIITKLNDAILLIFYCCYYIAV